MSFPIVAISFRSTTGVGLSIVRRFEAHRDGGAVRITAPWRRSERGTEADVAGAYNAVFTPINRTGARTSRIVDPPNGLLPSLTAEAQKLAAAEREFRVALLQSTATCKNNEAACSGGKYNATPSPRFAELPPRYNLGRMNRHDGPEDGTPADRCLTLGLPEFGGPAHCQRNRTQPTWIMSGHDEYRLVAASR
jgi:hypothetical protein